MLFFDKNTVFHLNSLEVLLLANVCGERGAFLRVQRPL